MSERRKPRRSAGFTLPRALPWPSFLSRVWPGTLIVCWTALTTFVITIPTWATLGAVAAVLVAATALLRVPAGALPRPPVWLWSGFIGGCAGAWLGEGVEVFLRASSVALIVVWGSSLLLWAVPTAAMTGALRVFLAPLRLFGAPVDEWALIMGEALRGMPMLRDQAGAVMDTVRLRLGDEMASMSMRGYARLAIDVVTASLSAASRGAAETGRAMSMRGGLRPPVGERVSLGWRDLVAALVCAAAVSAIVAAKILL